MKTALSLNQFRAAYRAGGFRSIVLTASGSQFYVTAQPRNGGPSLWLRLMAKERAHFATPPRQSRFFMRLVRKKWKSTLPRGPRQMLQLKAGKGPTLPNGSAVLIKL